MKQLKIRHFLKKNKKVVIGIITIASIFGLSKLSLFVEDSAMFGVGGTLLSVLLGGFLSRIGSIYVTSKQQKTLEEIKNKKEIYAPLYN